MVPDNRRAARRYQEGAAHPVPRAPWLRRTCVLVAGLLLAVGSARADVVCVPNDSIDGTCTPAMGALTINAGVVLAAPGDTVLVDDGSYTEFVTVNKNVTLLSRNGRAATSINPPATPTSTLGTILVVGPTTAVQIGATGQGFTINGVDNLSPGIESAAIYFQGNHSDAQILDNEVVANGDAGLQTEFGATISGFQVSGNTFSGQTFTSPNPAGCGFGSQFTLANVPRQLVTISGGAGGGSHSNITFTNNTITGTAGGCSSSPPSVGGCVFSGQEQGNTLVTIDANGATITGNSFSGTTSRFATSFRARGPSTSVSGNSFVSTGLVASCLTPTVPLATGQLFLQSTGQLVQTAAAQNTFDKGVYIDGAIGTIGLSIQAFVGAVPASTTVHVLSGTYAEQIKINTNGITVDAAPGTLVRPTTVVSDTTQGSPCSNGVGTAIVLVSGVTGVTLNGLTVDGSLLGSPIPLRFVGIYYRNASGAINGGSVLDIRNNPLNGVQNGLGILAQAKGPNSISVNVTGVTVNGYQKNGITFNGCGCADTPDGNVAGVASGNTVTGAGPTSQIAQNGFQVGFGAGPVTITGNQVSGNRYTGDPDNGTGSGILVFSSKDDIITLNQVSANNNGIVFQGGSFGLCVAGDSTGNSATCNRVADHNAFSYEIGISSDAAANAVHMNSITGNATGVDGSAITSGTLDAENNWWGAPDGPSDGGGTPATGSGDPVTTGVDFGPFATTPPACVACVVDADCDDGNPCNGSETCNVGGGTCVPGTPLNCDDGSDCTADSCDPAIGCVNAVASPDSDNDGYCDFQEVQAGCNPNDPLEIPPQANVFSGARVNRGGEILLTYRAPSDRRITPATDPSCTSTGVCNTTTGFCTAGKVSDPCSTSAQCNLPANTCRVVINYALPSVPVPDLTLLLAELKYAKASHLPVQNLLHTGAGGFLPATPGCSRKVDIALPSGFKRARLKLRATGTTAGRLRKDTDRLRYKQ